MVDFFSTLHLTGTRVKLCYFNILIFVLLNIFPVSRILLSSVLTLYQTMDLEPATVKLTSLAECCLFICYQSRDYISFFYCVNYIDLV